MVFKFSKDQMIRFIQRRLHIENQNFNIVICGGNGTGKSWASLYLASRIDPNFSIERVAFTPVDLFRILKSNFPKGACIVVEEAGVSADSRKFQEALNKSLAYMQQTIRMKNYCMIYNVPNKEWIDIRVRTLLHLYIEMKGINQATKRGIGKVNFLQPNYKMNKIYYHTPSIMRDRIPYEITTLRIPKPPQPLIEPYEKRKAEFVDRIIAEGLMVAERSEKGKQKSFDRDTRVYLDVVKKHPELDAQIDNFERRTGKSRATFYRIKRQVNEDGDDTWNEDRSSIEQPKSQEPAPSV